MERAFRVHRRGTTRIGLILCLAAATIPALALPASADDFAPEMVSFARTSTGLIGGNQAVSIQFTARDQGPAGLAYAYFTYRTPQGSEFRVDSDWMNRVPEGTFTATKLVNPWAASGTYVLERVELHDREWNATVYERATSTQFDFAAADFTIDNPNEDTTVPTLSSATLFQRTVKQGTPVVVLYGAGDDLSGVESVVFFGWTPTGAQYWIPSLPQLGAVGPASWLIPLESPSGTYESFGAQVTDRAGNSLLYRSDGQYPYPPKASTPAHTPPDLAELTFTVEGVVGDRIAPTMTDFSVLTPPTRRPGDLVALDFSAMDQGTGIEQVAAAWTDGKGHQIDASKTCGDLTHGPLSVDIEDYRSTDSDWQLEYVVFADYLGNQAAFRRDGTVAYQNTDPGVATHGFDLSRGDFHIEAGPPSPYELENTTRKYCRRVAQVSLGVDDSDVVIGNPVTSIGDVTIGDLPIPDPIVAIHEFIDGVPSLVEVVEGDGAGHFEDVFVPEAKNTIKATFLGADGPVGGDLTSSRGLEIIVRSAVRATVTNDRIPRGATTTLLGSATRTGDSEPVWLQRKIGDAWRKVQGVGLALDGSFSFTLRPKRTGEFRYRVLKPATDLLAVGTSRAITIRVTRRTVP